MMFGFIPPMLRPMAATGVPLGDVVIALAAAAAAVAATAVAAVAPAAVAAVAMTATATGVLPGDKGMALAFAATVAAAAATFVGGEVGSSAIVGVAWRELGLIKLCKYLGEFCW